MKQVSHSELNKASSSLRYLL